MAAMDIPFNQPVVPESSILAHLGVTPGLKPEMLTAFLNAMPVPLVMVSLETGKTILRNQAFCDTYACNPQSSDSWTSVFELIVDPLQRELVHQRWRMQTSLACAAKSQETFLIEEMELALLGKDGYEHTVLHSGVLLPAMRCGIGFYVERTARIANELKLATTEQTMREREILYPVLLELTPEMIVLTGVDGARSFVSPAVLPLTGWTQEEYLALRAENTVHPDDLSQVLATRKRCLMGSKSERVQYRTRRKDESWLWVEATAACYRDSQTQTILGYISTLRDSTERHAEEAKRAEREALLEQQARFDHLTRLANRHVFYTALSDEARRQTRGTQSLSLLLVDIDYFKLFNDRYGHLEGDRVLKQVADILKLTACRVADLVARFGGEEFVLLLPMTDTAGATAIAERILSAIGAEAIPHSDSPSGSLTVSIGLACWPGNKWLDRDALLLSADKALYEAKKQGRNRYVMSTNTPMIGASRLSGPLSTEPQPRAASAP
jgi:diguanylate cyclase (GGDEF)-like protein/PAS domain S-box-containing protein